MSIWLLSTRPRRALAREIPFRSRPCSKYGPGPAFNAVTSFCQSTKAGQFQTWAFPYSFACGWYQIGGQSFNAAPAWFGLVDAAGNDAFLIYSATAGTVGISFGNNATPFNLTTVADTFYVAVGSATGTTAGSNWINGVAQAANTAATGFTGTSMFYTFGAINANAANTADNINSATFFGAVWRGRTLTAADAVLLYTDPYCFLVPVEPEMMIIQTAAAPSVSEEVNWTIYRPRISRWGY